jgi:hypothetical protein
MGELPTHEETCRQARRLLSDARDWLRSDWRPGTGPTTEQAQARLLALKHIGLAKAALDQATRAGDR